MNEQALSYPIARKNPISNGILGMLFVLATEMMFFGGLISAYIINRANAGVWPPPGQPRLSIGLTAVNTIILLASAFTLYISNHQLKTGQVSRSKKLLIISLVLGLLFLLLQGREWMSLLNFGLTTRSGLYGAFFYTIIGAHALHALAGMVLLLYIHRSFNSKPAEETLAISQVCSLYWYFVAGIWPILYYLVYLF